MAPRLPSGYDGSVPLQVSQTLPWAQFFIERDSLELRQLHGFFTREGPSCDVVLAYDAAQAAVLTLRRRGRAQILVIQGGLADGRAEQLLAQLRAARDSEPFQWVALSDSRHCRGNLDEPRSESLEAALRPALANGWMLVRFLDLKKP